MELRGPLHLRHIGDKKYYFRLRQDGKEVFLQTVRFYSNGPFHSFGKASLFIPQESGVVDVIEKLENFCKEQVTCPTDAPSHWNIQQAWKECSGLFAKLSDNFRAFDREKKPIPTESLGRGYYTLRLSIPGVYLGESGSGAMACLQVKVCQTIFEPVEECNECLID